VHCAHHAGKKGFVAAPGRAPEEPCATLTKNQCHGASSDFSLDFFSSFPPTFLELASKKNEHSGRINLKHVEIGSF
jgi:hypothetical protein